MLQLSIVTLLVKLVSVELAPSTLDSKGSLGRKATKGISRTKGKVEVTDRRVCGGRTLRTINAGHTQDSGGLSLCERAAH